MLLLLCINIENHVRVPVYCLILECDQLVWSSRSEFLIVQNVNFTKDSLATIRSERYIPFSPDDVIFKIKCHIFSI